MLIILIAILVIYNIPNVRNPISVGLVLLGVILAMMLVAGLIFLQRYYKRVERSLLDMFLEDFTKSLPFNMIKVATWTVLLCIQYVYPDSAVMTDKFGEYMMEDIADDDLQYTTQWLSYNSKLVPKSLKVPMVLLYDMTGALREYGEDTEQVRAWYYARQQSYQELLVESDMSADTAGRCIKVLIVTTVLQWLWLWKDIIFNIIRRDNSDNKKGSVNVC